MKQWEVERGMRLAVKEMFDANGVGFPYPHLVTVPYEKPADFVGKEDIFVEKKDLHQDLESWQQVDADAVDI